MSTLVYAFVIVVLGLSAIQAFAINTSLKALRLADPALYRAAAGDFSGERPAGPPEPARPRFRFTPWPMHRWMRKTWRHRDIYKYRAVRRWMYLHHGAHGGLIAVFGFGAAMLLLS